MRTETIPAKTELKFNCPNCGQHILAASEWSGLGISCPSCQSRIKVPSPCSDESNAKPAIPSNPARELNPSGGTIRIELPTKPQQAVTTPSTPAPLPTPVPAMGTALAIQPATESNPASLAAPTSDRPGAELESTTVKVNGDGPEARHSPWLEQRRVDNTQKRLGGGPWPDLVRKLEQGNLVAPEQLATALFHELMDVRRRLERLESKLAHDKPARTNEIWRGGGGGGLQKPKNLEAAHVDSSGNGSNG